MKPSDDDLRNRFFYQPPRPGSGQLEAHRAISELTHALAKQLRDLCPDGRNLALALTHLEDVRMRANVAVACDWQHTT